MLGIAIHCIQHSQAMLERGVCELAHSFFHYGIFFLGKLHTKKDKSITIEFITNQSSSHQSTKCQLQHSLYIAQSKLKHVSLELFSQLRAITT